MGSQRFRHPTGVGSVWGALYDSLSSRASRIQRALLVFLCIHVSPRIFFPSTPVFCIPAASTPFAYSASPPLPVISVDLPPRHAHGDLTSLALTRGSLTSSSCLGRKPPRAPHPPGTIRGRPWADLPGPSRSGSGTRVVLRGADSVGLQYMPCGRSPKRRGSLRCLPPLEVRPSSVA